MNYIVSITYPCHFKAFHTTIMLLWFKKRTNWWQTEAFWNHNINTKNFWMNLYNIWLQSNEILSYLINEANPLKSLVNLRLRRGGATDGVDATLTLDLKPQCNPVFQQFIWFRDWNKLKDKPRMGLPRKQATVDFKYQIMFLWNCNWDRHLDIRRTV